MTPENAGDSGWNEWRDILLSAFESGLAAMAEKGYGAVPARKNFAALFLQVSGFNVPAAEILPEAIRIIKETRDNDSRYDSVAMMGHRIGMVDNISELNQYLQNMQNILKPAGQVLFTSINENATAENGRMPYRRQNTWPEQKSPAFSRQFQQEKLIGPYFSMLRVKAEALKAQAGMANWQFEMIYRQDDDNYLARLSLPGTGET